MSPDPGPASNRVSPDPGASTPGTLARGQRAVLQSSPLIGGLAPRGATQMRDGEHHVQNRRTQLTA